MKKDYEKLTAVMKHPRDFLMYDFMLRDEMLLYQLTLHQIIHRSKVSPSKIQSNFIYMAQQQRLTALKD